MKLVVAYIRPDRLRSVKEELFRQEVFKISAEDAFGCGELPDSDPVPPARKGFEKQVRLEIAVNEPFARRTVEARLTGTTDQPIVVVKLDRLQRKLENELNKIQPEGNGKGLKELFRGLFKR